MEIQGSEDLPFNYKEGFDANVIQMQLWVETKDEAKYLRMW